MRKRSVRLAGHQTSISIEDAFWDIILQIANSRQQSINALITEIDAARSGNLSSAIRVFALTNKDQAKPPSAPT
ncbi:MAG: ribbon-helix-helix domain-containing protein [Rhodospirillales bacterium]|nr:ribbon-helix-helix domain-containing protein [Rhodospirillales bacterium]